MATKPTDEKEKPLNAVQLIADVHQNRLNILAAALAESQNSEDLALEVYDAEQEITADKYALTSRKADILAKVSTEVDTTTNKPKYPNDTARQAAAAAKVADDAIAVTMQAAIIKSERRVKILRIEMEGTFRRIELARAFLRGDWQ